MKKYYSRLKMGSVAAALLCTSLTAETFTTCGATGAFGPDQAACDAAYTGTELEGLVTVTNGIQEWTVPTTGMYQITTVGAQGASGNVSYVGGLGAKITGEFELIAGETLQIVVGQLGLGQGSGSNGGGGGGSFVVDSADEPMIIAGGGGGTRAAADQNGCDASITEYGTIGGAYNSTSTCAEKTVDLGLGGIVGSSSYGAGGAGFNGDGVSDGTYGPGGSSWANGMVGGEVTNICGFSAHGGFGGGGAGNGCWGGGGAGGYSGGDGGFIAGGGGSYNIGENPEANASIGTGDGMVIITSLQASTPGAGITDGSGGGCTYNPNNRNIDLMFILMMGMALLYPFRRRYLK